MLDCTFDLEEEEKVWGALASPSPVKTVYFSDPSLLNRQALSLFWRIYWPIRAMKVMGDRKELFTDE